MSRDFTSAAAQQSEQKNKLPQVQLGIRRARQVRNFEITRSLYSLPARCVLRNPEMLELLAAAAKGDFQFELVSAAEILRSAVKRDESRDLGCQALFEIGGFKRTALDGDRAVRGRAGESDRRQRAGCAIGPDAGVNGDPHVAARRCLDLVLDEIGLRASLVHQRTG
jgi:hypothetical protein